MGQRIIAENAGVQSVSYALPNKHYIPVDMKYIGIDNLTPYVGSSFIESVLTDTYPEHMLRYFNQLLHRGEIFLMPTPALTYVIHSGLITATVSRK